ncbi:MAG: S41 family peptidase [bacterium]|nr:S41 family peptidase [Patescibacteria group bacterium]MDW8279870.1 S41 family peptidase [bacterium]
MKTTIKNLVLMIFAVSLILGSGFWLGYRFGYVLDSKSNFSNSVRVLNFNNSSSTPDFKIFWETWDAIHKYYFKDSNINDKDRVYGATKGLVKSLNDPYSEFFTPDEAKKFKEDVSGSFGGIGAEIGSKNNFIIIVAPLKNSPAEKAGLKPQDKILFIDSTSTDGMSIEDAVKIIRGQVGTEVKLTILRDGWEKPQEFKIIRQIIEIPTLDYEIKDGILIVKLYSFNANTERLFYNAVIDGFMKKNAKGLILDLRNNPGGYLDVAVDLAGWFLKKGTLIVEERGASGINNFYRANGNGALVDVPIVILINKGSASASEILAGALQIERGIKLVGEETFGKGTVQRLINLSDGSSLKITIANWVLPNGKILEGNGLKPDIEVKLDKESVKDLQLEKALEIIKKDLK